MPLEIRELHIKVEVADSSARASASSSQAPATPEQESRNTSRLIRQCVDEVMEIINKKKER
jgi:2,3-bisphosphoglycerate-independent phosphoglycerate mutase